MPTDPIFLHAGGKQLRVFGRTGTAENVAVQAHTSMKVTQATEFTNGSASSTTTLNTRFTFVDDNGSQSQHSYPGGAAVMRDGDCISLVYSGSGSTEAWSTIVNHDSHRIISIFQDHTFVYQTGAVWQIAGGWFVLSLLGFFGGPPLGIACIIGWVIGAFVQMWRAHSIWYQLSPVIDQQAQQLLSESSRPNTVDQPQVMQETTPHLEQSVPADRSIRRGLALFGGSFLCISGLAGLTKGEEIVPGVITFGIGSGIASLYWLLEPASSKAEQRKRPRMRFGSLLVGILYLLFGFVSFTEGDFQMILPFAAGGVFHVSLYWLLKR